MQSMSVWQPFPKPKIHVSNIRREVQVMVAPFIGNNCIVLAHNLSQQGHPSHKLNILKLLLLPALRFTSKDSKTKQLDYINGSLLSISKDGIVNFWSPTLEHRKTEVNDDSQTEPVLPPARTLALSGREAPNLIYMYSMNTIISLKKRICYKCKSLVYLFLSFFHGPNSKTGSAAKDHNEKHMTVTF